MNLKSLVSAAKSDKKSASNASTASAGSAVAPEQNPNSAKLRGIIETGGASDSTENGLYFKKLSGGGSTSITAIAREIEHASKNSSGAGKSWKDCAALKIEGTKSPVCLRFMALCAQEKCPRKYIS